MDKLFGIFKILRIDCDLLQKRCDPFNTCHDFKKAQYFY